MQAAPTPPGTARAPHGDADLALLEILALLAAQGYRFVTVTPSTHGHVNNRPHNQWAQTTRDIFGWNRPFTEDIVDPALLALMRRAHIVEPRREGWRSRVRVATLGEQFFLHSAFPTSAAESVFFGPDTYRFVNAIDAHLQTAPKPMPMRIADIGCGAGPGAIALARACPGAEVFALDINAAALRLAAINALFNRVPTVKTQFSNLLHDVDGSFDLLVANPPYLVDASQRLYRHGGGSLGSALSLAIVDAALTRLAPGGTLLLYTGVAIADGRDHFRAAAAEHLAAGRCTWSYREIDPDIFPEELFRRVYSQAERIAAVVLTVRRPAE